MPLVGFVCPDGGTIKKEECFKNCRLGDPCRSLRYLMAAGEDRVWRGRPSCTQLLNGTRMEFLKITRDYYINPDDRAYAVLGTHSHWHLDQIAKSRQELISEYKLNGDQIGTLDCLEPDRINGGYILYDNKTWGSFSVAKAFSGDMGDTELQLNFYRVKAERDPVLSKILGQVKINKMYVEAIVRDGGTSAAKDNKCYNRIERIEVTRLPDEKIIDYFNTKAKALINAVNKNVLPPACDIAENWNWRRCKIGLCDVATFCAEGIRINKLAKGGK